jgi:hypothetical protein
VAEADRLAGPVGEGRDQRRVLHAAAYALVGQRLGRGAVLLGGGVGGGLRPVVAVIEVGGEIAPLRGGGAGRPNFHPARCGSVATRTLTGLNELNKLFSVV